MEQAVVRALIVDDELDMLMLMRTMLTFDGEVHVVGEASNGEEAFEAWQATRPDVVVLDMRMPGASGLEVARRILAIDPAQLVIMCSAYMDAADLEEAQAVGVAACLEKNDIGRLAQVVLSVTRAA